MDFSGHLKVLTRPKQKQKCYGFRLFKLEKMILSKEDVVNIHKRGEPHKPLPRSGHRLVNDGSNLYAIGGYNPHIFNDPLVSLDGRGLLQGSAPLFYEIWKFSIARKVWTLLEFTGPMPTQLASHAAVMLPDCENVLVYGGTGHPFGRNASNRLNAFNTRLLRWKEVVHTSPEQNAPEQLYGQAVLFHDGFFYTLGGTSGHDYSSDVHRFDFRDGQWEKLNLPSDTSFERNRYRHEIVLYNEGIIVIGGGTATSVKELDSFDIFDLPSRRWIKRESKPDPVSGYPSPRRCHSIERKEQFVYVFGGYNGTQIFDDMWRLGLDTFSWLRLIEHVPRKVYFHSSTLTEEGRMFIFGGVCNVENMEHNVRTNDLYSVWVGIPKLQRMAWEAMLFYGRPNLSKRSAEELREAGIPKRFVEELEVKADGG